MAATLGIIKKMIATTKQKFNFNEFIAICPEDSL